MANDLKNVVNVAKVDVPMHRDLGTRFEIKGFPTVLMLSKGKVYKFKGRRSQEELVEFARGGFQIQEAEQEVPGELGYFGHIIKVFQTAWRQATDDIKYGVKRCKKDKSLICIKEFFTSSLVLMAIPIVFGFILLAIILIPVPKFEESEYQQQPSIGSRLPNAAGGLGEAATSSTRLHSRVNPPTSASDSAVKEGKND